jgi:hypothetical protein
MPPPAAAIVLPCDERSIPAQQGIGRDEGGDLEESTASSSFRAFSEATPLHVGEPDLSSTELVSEDAVLLAEILDCVVLTAVHPAGENEQEKLKPQLMHDIEGSPNKGSAAGQTHGSGRSQATERTQLSPRSSFGRPRAAGF